MTEPISQEEFDQMWDDKKVEDPIIASVVLHYANWCAWSEILLPHWDKFEEYVKINLRMLKVDKINYSNDKHPPTSLEIRGYPTIIFYVNDKPCDKLEGYDEAYTDIVKFCCLSAFRNIKQITAHYQT